MPEVMDDVLFKSVIPALESRLSELSRDMGLEVDKAVCDEVVETVRRYVLSPSPSLPEPLESLLAHAASSDGATVVMLTTACFYEYVNKRRKKGKEARTAAKTLLEALVAHCSEGVQHVTMALLLHAPNDLLPLVWERLLNRLNDIPNGVEHVTTGVFDAIASPWEVSRGVSIKRVRDVALRCLSQPDQVKSILHLGLKRTEARVRIGAFNLVTPLLTSHLKMPEDLIETAFIACSDDCDAVRAGAASMLGSAFDECPQKAEEITNALLRLCSEVNGLVKTNAIRSLATAIGPCPQRQDSIVDILLRGCHDQVMSVRMAAISGLPGASLACPEKAEQLHAEFVNALRSSEVCIKCCTIEAVADARKAWPRLTNDLLNLIQNSMQSRNSQIREAIVGNSVALIKAFPTLEEALVETLLAACHGSHSRRIRLVALKQLASAAKACPQRSDEMLLELLLGAFSRKENVRAKTLRQIPEAIKEVPSWGKKLISTLIGGCHSDREKVRKRAKEQLEESLRACPEAAIEFASRMQASESGTGGSTSGTPRKRTSAGNEDPRPARRRRTNRELMPDPSNNVTRGPEQNNSRSGSRLDDNKEALVSQSRPTNEDVDITSGDDDLCPTQRRRKNTEVSPDRASKGDKQGLEQRASRKRSRSIGDDDAHPSLPHSTNEGDTNIASGSTSELQPHRYYLRSTAARKARESKRS